MASASDFLGEFTQALEQEIDAARANLANTAIVLTDGRLVAPVGGCFHYDFTTSARVRVPPDTDAQLYLPSASAKVVNVVVLEASDLGVKLAVPSNIGRLVPQARLQADLTMLLRRLIGRIEEKASERWPAADRMLGLCPPSGTPVRFTPHQRSLNLEQVQAVASALGRDLTFVWGPPGTGKTFAIGELGFQLFSEGKTLLIASHTNTAVDGAVLKVIEALEGRFREGEILRVGEPVKPELAAREAEVEVVMRKIAEKRETALKARQEELVLEREATIAAAGAAQRLFEVAEWLRDAPADLQQFQARGKRVSDLKFMEWAITDRRGVLAHERDLQEELREQARSILESRARMADLRKAGESAKAEASAAEDELRGAETRLGREVDVLRASRSLRPLRLRAQALPTREGAQTAVAVAQAAWKEANDHAWALEEEVSVASKALALAQTTGAIKRAWLRLPDPDVQAGVVDELRVALVRSRSAASAAAAGLAAAKSVESETLEVLDALAPHSSVPEVESQETVVAACGAQVAAVQARLFSAEQRVSGISEEIRSAERAEASFVQRHGFGPEEALSRAEAFWTEVAHAEKLMTDVQAERQALEKQLSHELARLLEVLAGWNLGRPPTSSVDELLASVQLAVEQANDMVAGRDLTQIRLELDTVAADAQHIEDELRAIARQLASLDADLIANATVLATTLTRSYMRDAIQGRTFDTVLVDEASMAAIPALWAVATLASRAMVLVGDFLQLPPIVQSEEVIAKKWLGRDVFNLSGMQGVWEKGEPPHEHFVALREQHRMHPDICAIPNALIYRGQLRDGSTVLDGQREQSLREWLTAGTAWTSAVGLIDTAELAGWNTRRHKSRFNPLSAFVTAELAGAILRPERPAGTQATLGFSPLVPTAPTRGCCSCFWLESSQMRSSRTRSTASKGVKPTS